MRITNNMLINNMTRYIGNNLGRMEKFQQQLATGKKIAVPSDDPVVAARALKLRTDVSEVDQYKRNVKDARSWLDITESTLSNITDIFQRARELTVQGSNGSQTPEDTQKIGAEMEQLKNQLVNLGNATYAGRYIFSGNKTDTPLLNDDGTFAINVSNSESIKYEISIGDNININVPGGDLFNSASDAASGSAGKMVANFDSIIGFLQAGDNGAVGDKLADLDADINNLLRVRADVGARMNRLDMTNDRLDSDSINYTALMSNNEDVDMAETIMNLKNEENVYNASLAGGARIIQPSLVDFLR